MQTVSAAFSAAEVAPIAQVAAKVFIYRGDYASAPAWVDDSITVTATASDTDGSGNFPPAGAVNGDRTELNVGAASTADNGVGLASWRGSATPSGGSPSWLQVAFGASRTFNYVKLYNLSTNPLTVYTLQYWNGSAWATFATYSAAARANGGLDVYDFSAAGTTFTSTEIRVLITGSTSGAANVVELEVYYKVDVTARCCSIKTDRQRDWKQVNPMAATSSLVFNNSDRFFSPRHVPTQAEVAAGYFNPELDEDLKVQVQLGFWQSGTPYFQLGWNEGGFGEGPFPGAAPGANSSPELCNVFVGSIDSLKASSKAGTCSIEARDGMKAVINMTWSTRLKYNIDMGAAVQYQLNICNVSNYEMNVAMTGLLVPYYFAYEASSLTEVQELVQASGAAAFWYDENGIAQFANLLAEDDSSQTDFTWTGADASNFYASYNNGGTFAQSGSGISLYGGAGGSNGVTAALASTQAQGWAFQFGYSGTFSIGLVMFAAVGDGTSLSTVGYGLEIENTQVLLNKYTGVISSPTNIGTYSGVPPASSTFVILRDSSGHFYVWMNSVLIIGPVTDTTYTSFDHFTATASGPNANIQITNISFLTSGLTIAFSGGTLTVTSEIIDQGASVAAEGALAVGFSPSNAPITYQTRTAVTSGGISSASWTSVSLNTTTQRGPILSTTARYIQYQFYFTVGSVPPLWAPYYATVNWSLTAVASTVRQVSYESQLCDVTETISGNLGGDSSIINYFEVISSPTVLTGTTADVQWTATTGQPVTPVSASNPLIVAVGTITIQAVIGGGMDITYMGVSITGTAGNSYGGAGAIGTGTAFLVTFGTAAGTVSISYIHPTRPVITLTITTAGTITNLQLIGQAFSSAQNAIDVIAPPLVLGMSPSQAKYNRRTRTINNNYIPNPAVAQLIANSQLALYQVPADVLTGVKVLLMPSVQFTDELQATDYNLDIPGTQDWEISGVSHEVTLNGKDDATIESTLTALVA